MDLVTFNKDNFKFVQETWVIDDKYVSTFTATYRNNGKQFIVDLTKWGFSSASNLLPFGSKSEGSSRDIHTISKLGKDFNDTKRSAGKLSVEFNRWSKLYVDDMCKVASEAFADYLSQFKNDQFIEHVKKSLTFDNLDKNNKLVKRLIDEEKTFDDIKSIVAYLDLVFEKGIEFKDDKYKKYHKLVVGDVTTVIVDEKELSLKNLVDKRFSAKFKVSLPSFTIMEKDEPSPVKVNVFAIEIVIR